MLQLETHVLIDRCMLTAETCIRTAPKRISTITFLLAGNCVECIFVAENASHRLEIAKRFGRRVCNSTVHGVHSSRRSGSRGGIIIEALPDCVSVTVATSIQRRQPNKGRHQHNVQRHAGRHNHWENGRERRPIEP